MNMKSVLHIFGILLCLAAFSGCAMPETPGSTLAATSDAATPPPTEAPTATTAPTPTETPTATPAPTKATAATTPAAVSDAAAEFLQKLEVGKLVALPEHFSYDLNGDGIEEEVTVSEDHTRTGDSSLFDYALCIDGTEFVLTKYCSQKRAYGLLLRPGCLVFVFRYSGFDFPDPWHCSKAAEIFYYSEAKELRCLTSFDGTIREFLTAVDSYHNAYVSGFVADVEICSLNYLLVEKEFAFSQTPVDPYMEYPFRYEPRVVERPLSGYFFLTQSAVLRRDLPIYRNIYSDEVLTTLPAGTEVFWSATDGVEWMYIDSFGTGGWIRFHGEYVILNGEELYHADVFFLPIEAG